MFYLLGYDIEKNIFAVFDTSDKSLEVHTREFLESATVKGITINGFHSRELSFPRNLYQKTAYRGFDIFALGFTEKSFTSPIKTQTKHLFSYSMVITDFSDMTLKTVASIFISVGLPNAYESHITPLCIATAKSKGKPITIPFTKLDWLSPRLSLTLGESFTVQHEVIPITEDNILIKGAKISRKSLTIFEPDLRSEGGEYNFFLPITGFRYSFVGQLMLELM